MQRTVAPGSRQAPDPHDQYLEKLGYYRKHTGRDSSNLFRVISEQLYDTQKFHLQIREECVGFMRRHRAFYSQFVREDFDDYLLDLSKPRTHGGILEFRALAAQYRRNMFVFESYGNDLCSNGKYLDYNPEYTRDFQIFYTPDRHFDTIYHVDYVENLAFCQALAYEILYRGVFKLPDINYAVERMLHDPDGVTTSIVVDPTHKWCGEFQDFGEMRQFYFDRAEETNCVLNNRDLCNFHNPQFQEFVAKVKKQDKEKKTQDMPSRSRTLASMLPMKDISCVCQLLNEQITPFPYKVAKSLDPYIYRNVDFDVWSDTRRELRALRWDRNYLRVGVRCAVKLHSSQDQLYNCYIQDIPENGSCEVFVEELGEKHRVPILQLQPLNGHQWRSWMVPLKYPRHTNDKRLNGWGESPQKKGMKTTFSNLMQYTTFDEIKPYPMEVVAMPALTGGTSANGKNAEEKPKSGEKEKEDAAPKQEDVKFYEDDFEYCHEVPYGAPAMPLYYPLDPMAGMYMMPPQYGMPMHPCYGNVWMYPPTSGPLPPPNTLPIYHTPSPASGLSLSPPHLAASPNSMHLQGSAQMCNGQLYFPDVDYNAVPSVAPNAADLPLNDLKTIQFFYNTGIEYFTYMRENFGFNTPIMGMCDVQGIPLQQQMPTGDLENNERICVQQSLNIKIDCDPQGNPDLQQQHPSMNAMPPNQIHGQNTPQHGQQMKVSGQHSSGNRTNQRHRKEHTPKSATKKHNYHYYGKHQQQGENYGKNCGVNQGRDVGDGKSNHGENQGNGHGYHEQRHEQRHGVKNENPPEPVYNIPPPPLFGGYPNYDGEPTSPHVNPYGSAQYYSPNQGMSMPMYPVMPPAGNYPPPQTPTSMAAAPCTGPDVTVMPPPIFPQAAPRGMGGGGNNGVVDMGNFVHGPVVSGGCGGGGMNAAAGGMGMMAPGGGGNSCGPSPRGNDNGGVSSSPYCVIPPPSSFQYQPHPNRPANNWYPITSRPPPPSVVVSHSGNLASGIYPSPTADIPH
uniref:Protein ovarian tumor n=1 Tax=Lutzomyia longipalpis TaxID=7200 RepID=A0A7G3ATW2_LUTLO